MIAAMTDPPAHNRMLTPYPRRPSLLGEEMAKAKIARARNMTPEERLLLTLELSDLCLSLEPPCSPKP
jgi:hypothetical protein